MRYFLVVLSVLILFSWRFLAIKQPNYPSGTRIKITAALKEEPKIIGNTQKFTLAGIKITTWRYPDFHYGDRLIVTGSAKDSRLEFPEIETDRDRVGDRGIIGIIFDLRNQIENIYKKYLPEPQAGLFSGMVLGSKSGLPKDFNDVLRSTGTMHVVVASGMNVTIIASTTLSFLLFFLSRKRAVILSILLIWFYVVLAGAEVPVVRAGIMGSIIFTAQVIGRESDGWRALALAAGALLLINPLSLLDLGFQLSFAATAGILLFTKPLNKLFYFVPKQIRGDLSQTLSAQFMTLPIILISFGFYSVLSPLVNILIAFTLMPIMRLGLLVGAAGLIFEPLGQLLAFLVLPFLTYFVEIVTLFSNF